MNIKPKNCTSCGGKIEWIVFSFDNVYVKWLCTSCSAVGSKLYEHPEITKGRRIANHFKNMHPLNKRITRLSCRMQIGILRENDITIGEK